MKNFIQTLVLLVFSLGYFAQSSVDSLVAIGIQYHDNGAYDLAVEKYKEALKIDPKSQLVNYEIAMTYVYMQEYQKAIEHSDIVLDQKDNFMLEAYMTKGSCLDYLGQTKESIKLFKKAIKKYGEHHLLYYNLAYDYYKIKEDDKAEEALINAISLEPGHASSHLLLGYLKSDHNYTSQGLLCLHYFLFLEPDSDRAKAAYDLLREQMGGNVESDPDNPDQITIYMSPGDPKSEFSAADLMISMLAASKGLEENEGKTDEELFIDNTTSFFKILGELKDEKTKNFWMNFYVPLFYDIAKSDHMETYCKYISMGSDQDAAVWIRDNSDKLKEFVNWLQGP